MWELDDRHWAHSRLTCAAGLYAMAAQLPRRDVARATGLADGLVADTAADCLHPDGRWQRAPDDSRVDAALLLPALRGAVPLADPRSTTTLAAVAAELGEDGYLYRFRHDARPLGHAEGAFTLCGFWTALATHQQGRPTSKVALLARGRAGVEAAAQDVPSAGGTPLLIPTDVADAEQVERAADLVEAELGPIDVWVNVAFTSVFAPFHTISHPGEATAAAVATGLLAAAVLRRRR